MKQSMRLKRFGLGLGLGLGLGVGCVRDHQPPLPAAPAPQRTAAVVASAPVAQREPLSAATAVDGRVAALLDSGELIVGNRVALEAWRPDGSSHRTISPGAALHPRRFGRDHVLALRNSAGGDLRDGAVLELIALADGKRRELAQLPSFRCAGSADVKPQRLDIEDPSDFEVNSAHGVACLGVMDAASSSASVRVRARVELSSARVQRWLALGDAACNAPDGVQVGDPAADGVCWRIADVTRHSPDPTSFAFTFDNEYVRSSAAGRGSAKLQVRGYELDQASPSERWLLLAGDFTERESTYRRLLLLDRSRGKLFPLVERAGAWPAPLTAAGSKLHTPIKQAQLMPSSADVRWLGTSEDTEVLVLDKLVIKPGRPTFEITEGELAR